MILGIDSSGLACTVALADRDVLLGEYTVDFKKTHSETLLPMIDALVKEVGVDKKEIEAIACASGPGSFTGLRIGCATAKGIGLAMGVPIVPVPTLMGLAFNCAVSDRLVVPLMDARRGQVYTAAYSMSESGLEGGSTSGSEGGMESSPEGVSADGELRLPVEVLPQQAVAVEEIIERVNELGRPVVYLGDGVPVFAEKLRELTRVNFAFAPLSLARQRAGSVAALGRILLARSAAIPAADFRPEYLRLSQAERERKEKEKAEKAAASESGEKPHV